MPLMRHLKKSDMWDSQARLNDGATPPPMMKKLETFDGKENNALLAKSEDGGGGKLRKESSLS